MDKVRLEVLETKRNSEKPRPKARIPPILSVKREYNRVESSDTRNNFSDVLRLSPEGKHRGERMGSEMWNNEEIVHPKLLVNNSHWHFDMNSKPD